MKLLFMAIYASNLLENSSANILPHTVRLNRHVIADASFRGSEFSLLKNRRI